MNRSLLSIACLAGLLTLGGCADLLEKDITGFGVVLLTPPDGHSTSSNVLSFQWEAVPYAEGYRIQIATPTFANPVLFVFDSVVTSARFSASLVPGSYQWRVRGENPNSTTAYYQRSLVVTEATSLEGLTPLLIAPAQNAAIAADTIALSWQALSGAEDYRVELRSGSQSGELVSAQIVAEPSFSLSGLDEGPYTWGVQAQNTTGTSNFSYRSLTVDRTAPSPPVLLAPLAAATLPNTSFTFQWQSGGNAGAGATDSLFVEDNAQQTVRALLVPTTTYTDSLGTGTYTWYVRTTDLAGNGTSSTVRALTIQ
jgi:hypothetical protein